ncbi:MAG: L,D-transpeptidase [Acidobacteria bacterium]|nr:L,D-transpeptidase [Acidobacteriota bacterium]
MSQPLDDAPGTPVPPPVPPALPPLPAAPPAPRPRSGSRRLRTLLWGLAGFLGVFAGFAGIALIVAYAGGYAYAPASAAALPELPPPPAGKALSKLEKQFAALQPKGNFIVVDVVEQKVWLRRGDQVLREAVCSAGTGAILRDPKSGIEWIFDTPRGVRKVKEKKKDPVWTKPDWAFVEEGEPLPKKWSERIDEATLGEYALYLGDGYMIHGTLYQRYLGRPVTHGCIRLGDDDLEAIYQASPVGTPVLLF